MALGTPFEPLTVLSQNEKNNSASGSLRFVDMYCFGASWSLLTQTKEKIDEILCRLVN